MRLRVEPLDVATRFTFRIARGAAQAHDNSLVRLEHEGIEGLGEASPSHYYGENRATVEAALRAWAPAPGDDPFALDALSARLDEVLAPNAAARAALDMALHDWIGKRLGLPVRPAASNSVAVRSSKATTSSGRSRAAAWAAGSVVTLIRKRPSGQA